MRKKIFTCITFLFVLFSYESRADVCDSLRIENAKLNFKSAGILVDHPVLTTVFAGCAVGGLSNYENTNDAASATIVFLGCTGFACMFSEDGSCKDTAKRWFEIILKKSSVNEDAKKYGCSL